MASYYLNQNINNSNLSNLITKYPSNDPHPSTNFNTYSEHNNSYIKPYLAPKFQNQSEQFTQFNNTNRMQEEQLKLIQSLEYVAVKNPELVHLNANNKGLSLSVKNQFLPRFFVIKSFTEEDIHKVFYNNSHIEISLLNMVAGPLPKKEIRN
jgi:hypothetical protein